MKMSDRYSPKDVEDKLYSWWESQGYFKAEDKSTKPPFCVILPPPNVTGFLHLGHALNHSLQDCLVRWKRMSGYNALWLPGTDHAGIATQAVVEKSLAKDGVTRQDLGREKFVEKVWEWKDEYGDRIVNQMKKLGDSCDWSRLTFTLDDSVSKSVRRVFNDLYKKDLIYHGTRLINWSPKLESALSDIEVDHKDVKGSMWHIKYPVDGTDQEFVVATTRPETLLGDSAVAVHPDDERYKHLIGKQVSLPLTDRKIPIIADEYVDKDFGTGVVKITPAHDFNDYEVGKRHDLAMINILNKNGTLNEFTGEYEGLKVQNARKKIVEDLESKGLLDKVEVHKLSVGHCSRSGCVVEPMLSPQWFVKTEELAERAKRAVESGTTKFVPELWSKTYLHWMNNIQDWCVSRQLWWGHQIPAWNCEDCKHITVAEETPKKCESCGSEKLLQEEDVLDTWFSSALWPFSTMGWPNETESLKTFYPTTVLITGHDIIFFWVARMMMMGIEFRGDIPFRTVNMHGIVRDSNGIKMSKSTGNSIDPLEVIGEYGADALRFTLLSQSIGGKDIKFSNQNVESSRNFMNKVWNAARFALQGLEGFEYKEGEELPPKAHLSDADQWITIKLKECEEEVDKALDQMRFGDATRAIYSFAWNEFCDWYLEFIKPIIYGDKPEEKRATQVVLAQTLNRLMRLLHPFAPFISEEIYQKLPIKSESLVIAEYPTPSNDKDWLALGSEDVAFDLDLVKDVIASIRNIRGENLIKPSQKIVVTLNPAEDRSQKILGVNKSSIMKLAGLSDCTIGEPATLSKSAVSLIKKDSCQVQVVIPLEGLVDLEEEIKRIAKNIEKLQKESGSLSKRLSNENFLKNAPDDVVVKGKKQLEDLSIEINSLQESLQRLK